MKTKSHEPGPVTKKVKLERDSKAKFSKGTSPKNSNAKLGNKMSSGMKKEKMNRPDTANKSKGFKKMESSNIKKNKSSPVKEFKIHDAPKQGKLVSKKPKFIKNPTIPKKKMGAGKGKKNTKGLQDIPAHLLGKDGKPNWDKLKLEKKKLKLNRKVHKTGAEQYELSVKAKSIWEKLRRRSLKADKKEELVNELFTLLKGSIPNVVHSHDLTRVVQWMLKLGSPSVRTSICEELHSNTVLYLQSKYASFCVKRALKYGSKADRNHLIDSCNGHFLKLLGHSFASRVIELMYSTYASAKQRKQMHRELYGEMHALLPPEVSTIETVPTNLKAAILAATKSNLTKLLSKKQFLKSTLLQSILNDYLSSTSNEDRTEIFELIQGDILDLLDTKEGSKVALLAVWYATNKMKKIIIKSLKGKLNEIATSETGHVFLMALFDCIDDTVLVKKALIPELLSVAEELANHELGRKVILYLVAHRDPAYFHPQQIEMLSKGDSVSTGKKDRKVREEEMLAAVSSPLLQMIARNPDKWFAESSVAMVSLAIMKTGKGDALQAAFEKLVDYILDPSSVIEVKQRQCHVIEHSALHLVFKKLILLDQSHADRTKETFSTILATRLTATSLNHLLQFNRGCFLLVLLFESTDKKVGKTLASKITEPMKKFLVKQETTGAKILLKKLDEL